MNKYIIKSLSFLALLLYVLMPDISLGADSRALDEMDFSYVHPMVRIKDIADLEGARSNQLTGIGVVMGLAGTGDKVPMAMQMMKNVLSQYGLSVEQRDIRSKNVAVVSITADLPPYVRPGQTIDISVNAMGDAKSLQGGTLLQAPLKAADGRVYAVAQGSVLVGGYAAGGSSATTTKNIPTAGRIPNGAIVERDVPTDYADGGQLAILLRQPDFTTAQRITDTLNSAFGRVAYPADAGRIIIDLPPQYVGAPTAFIAKMEKLEVEPDVGARVAVNERTGTVVMGGDVKISSVAVAHGNLTVSVSENTNVVQPGPMSGGNTAAERSTNVDVDEGKASFVALPATTTVKDLVKVINATGASPRDVIEILQAINEAGALHGQLINM
ncbi:flagellar P-ring protein [Synergistales bacterium]|nr:flagellar P-ring protein [Synergistales bacterium]